MVLNPLTEVVIRVFMAVGVGSGQFMMHVLRNGKRCQHKEQKNKTGRQTCSQSMNQTHITHKKYGPRTTIPRVLSNKHHAK